MIGWAVAQGVAAAGGAVLGGFLACVPGLHVYTVLGAAVALLPGVLPGDGALWGALVTGLVVGYAVLSAVPSILLGAPDESAVLTVLPGQKLLMQGRGREAVRLVTVGAGAGVLGLLAAAPWMPRLLPPLQRIVRPHTHWILWCVIAFLLLSEWPRGGRLGPSGWRRFAQSWVSTGVGLLTFLLSGLLGFVLLYRSPLPERAALQGLMPAFVGLFAVPWLVVSLFSRAEAPPQRHDDAEGVPAGLALRGALVGLLGGGLAAFLPVVSGGVGGLLAGHAGSLRDDRAFLVSQGASKTVYYAGALLLLFVPGLHLLRGGAALLLGTVAPPPADAVFLPALAALAVAGAVSILLADPLSRVMLRVLAAGGTRRVTAVALLCALLLVAGFTGAAGLAVTAVAAAIGLLPVLYGARRLNGLGVILLPMACGLSGVGERVAAWLGLG